MARIVVVGGGLGGLATAARLAKLGHEVAVLEAAGVLGGALAPYEEHGFTWDLGPTTFTLPAVLRDLFRKSGRPLETELGSELVALPVAREHRFADRTSIRVPAGSRAEQVRAFDGLDPGLGEVWTSWVDQFSPVWEAVRRGYAETAWDRDGPDRDLREMFESRETLWRRLRREFRDERLALIAGHPFTEAGHDLRNVPVWAGLEAYLEQCFGVWAVPGGMGRLRDLLTQRLSTRAVVVRTGLGVVDVVVRGGRAVGVQTPEGVVDADAVVCATDPRGLPVLARYVGRTMPAFPPVITLLGLEGVPGGVDRMGELPDVGPEVVVHGEPTLTVRTGAGAPSGHSTWAVHGRGQMGEDVLKILARADLDVRGRVVHRVDLSPRDLVQRWHGSPFGVAWNGRRTVFDRLGPTTPVPGLYAAGAHAAPGGGLPFTGLSAALVAEAIGPA